MPSGWACRAAAHKTSVSNKVFIDSAWHSRRGKVYSMHYDEPAIPETAVPVALSPVFQHAVDTYASEINKVASVWRGFSDADLGWRPDPKSSTVLEILKHELLSQRRF